jgi:hypothetical protein
MYINIVINFLDIIHRPVFLLLEHLRFEESTLLSLV